MESFGLKDALTDVLQTLSASVADLIPRVLTALIVIVIGIIFAKIVRRLMLTAFSRLRIDTALERVGVTGLLSQIGYRASPSEGFATLVYYLLVILFVQSATQSVGLLPPRRSRLFSAWALKTS